MIKGEERCGSNTDLALYTLFSNVRVVVIRADLVTTASSVEADIKMACSELGFDPAIERTKTRVVCVVLDRHHFQIGVVRTPQVRAVFQMGSDWDEARRLILTFIKARSSPDVSLGPPWVSYDTTATPTTVTVPLTTDSFRGRPGPWRALQASHGRGGKGMHAHSHHTTQHAHNTHNTPNTIHLASTSHSTSSTYTTHFTSHA